REQDVVERLAAGLRRLERDLELFLDARLPDEVSEGARTQRPLDLLLGLGQGGREELGHAARRSASRTCSATGRRWSTAASPRSASGSDQPRFVSASRASVDSSPSSTRSAASSFSFSSSTTRWAVFRPTPGIAWNLRTSSLAIARRSSAGVEPETIASATLGPTPDTPSSSSNNVRSSVVEKPYSCSASSRTIVCTSTVTSPSPTPCPDRA